MGFHKVAQRPQAESFLRYIDGRPLTHEEYFALRAGLPDLSSHFYSIEGGKADVEHNQGRFQFFGFMDASNPSEASPMTFKFCILARVEQMNPRKGS
jgi:hypothetical protein